MMQSKSRYRACLPVAGALAALALLPVPAEAQYLDPGAGSILIQALVAVAVGVAATLKIYWAKISASVTRRSKKDTGL